MSEPGETVVEAGGGWGGFARYLVQRYGVNVRSYNISSEQIAYARRRAQQDNLQGIEYIEDDYRNTTGEFDVFVSVGMLEHVGVANYPELGRVVDPEACANGMTMGSNLDRNELADNAAPEFFVWAMRDRETAPLQCPEVFGRSNTIDSRTL